MSQCLNNTAVPACYTGGATPQSVVVHYVYDNAGAPKVVIADLAGVPVVGATLANTSIGACVIAPPDVEWAMLCDVQANGSAIEFFRRSITSFNALGVATVTVTNWALDKVTAYVPVGTVDSCPSCAQLAARGVQAAW